MGMSFHDCSLDCGNYICDAGPYFRCGCCSSWICDDCAKEKGCGKYSNLPPEVDEDGEPYDEDSRGCPFCSLEVIDDSTLLKSLLAKLGVSRENVCEEYRASLE